MSPDLQLEMAKISVTDFKAGIDQVETEATRHATELANKEYQIEYKYLEADAKNAVRSLAAAKTVHEFKVADLHDHAILVGSLTQDSERAQGNKKYIGTWYINQYKQQYCTSTYICTYHGYS